DPDLLQEPLRSEGSEQLAAEHLERDRPVVPEIVRQPHRRHSAPAELALDPVAVGQGGGEDVGGGRRHIPPWAAASVSVTMAVPPVGSWARIGPPQMWGDGGRKARARRSAEEERAQ